VHSLDNVVVADSSVFVTSAGYGPTLTLVALAARAAHHLAGTTPEAVAPASGAN
jgi:choline dehydrogenase-like flavoprotein